MPDASHIPGQFCRRTRREMLWQAGGGFAAVALSAMLGNDFFSKQSYAADGRTAYKNPLAPKSSLVKAKAKNVIFLFMYGGPSQVDTFDYKPKLNALDGQTVPVKTFGRSGKKERGTRRRLQMELQTIRPMRQVRFRSVSKPRPVCR